MIKIFVAVSAIILNCLHVLLPEEFQLFSRCYVSGALGMLVAKCIEDYQWNNFMKAKVKQWEDREKNESRHLP